MITFPEAARGLQEKTRTPNTPLQAEDLANAASLFPTVPDGFPETRDEHNNVVIKQGHFRVQLRLPLGNGDEEAIEVYLPVSHARGHALIPRDNIFGTQPPNEYDEKDIRAIRKMMHNPPYAASYLAHNPVVCAVVPDNRPGSNNTMRVVALDGHHRNRALTFNNVPVAYFTPEELAKGAKRIGSSRRDKAVTTDELIQALNHTANVTMDLFELANMDPTRHPIAIAATSVEDFANRFPRLNHNGTHLQ